MATSTNTTKTASSTVMTVVDARPAKTEDADSSNSIRSHSKENDQQPTEAVCATDQQQRHSQTGLGDDFTHKQWQQSEEQSSTTSSSSRSSSRSSSLNSIAPELSAIGAANINSPTTTTTPPTTDNVKRQFFWRNIVKQFNFTDEQERKLLISLTHGIEWMNMKTLPKAFIQRHREIFYLISTPDYQRSGMIQRDVTRTFSIFERSHLPDKDIASQQQSLFRVLNAISEAEDGYCQGMNFIAALFLVEGLDEADAYALFLYLLKKRHLARIYQRSSTFLDDYLEHFNLMFQRELPDLHQHILAQGFVVPMYGIEWFTTLFSLSTKADLACAIFDMFFVGVQDIFLRMGLAILKLLESKLMCMTFEDFLREFKPLVRQIDPYQAVLKALSFRPNPLVRDEDTTAYISRAHFLLSAHQNESNGHPSPPKTFDRHRTLPPPLAGAIVCNQFQKVFLNWQELITIRPCAQHCVVLANEILHYAIWYGQVSIACFAIERCGADVNNVDDTNLTPLHYSVIRNQPDMVRLLLCFGADEFVHGGRWNGSFEGLTPLETAQNWRFRDTSAARLVLEKEICLFCNTKIDKLAFGKETCAQCMFTYCHRPHVECIGKHQCPRDFRESQRRIHFGCGTANAEEADTPKSKFEGDNKADSCYCDRHSSASTSASTVNSSRRSSLSCSASDSSSSLAIVQSPTNSEFSATARQQASHDDKQTRMEEGQGILAQLSSWFGSMEGVAAVANVDDARENSTNVIPTSSSGSSEKVKIALEFPDRPEWYCNAAECHTVFAFFSQRLECSCCGGFFCSADFMAKTRLCLRCDGNAGNV